MYHCHKCKRLCQLHKGKYIPHKECKCDKGKSMKCSVKRRPLSEPDKKGIKIDDWLRKHQLKRKINRKSSSSRKTSDSSRRSSSRRSSSGGFEIKNKYVVEGRVRRKSVKARRTSSDRGTKVVAVPVHRKKKSMSIEERNFFWDQFAKKKKRKKRKHTKKRK